MNNSKTRLLLYTVCSILLLVIPVLVTFGFLGQDQADQVGRLITALLGLFGSGVAGTAAVVLGKQRKDGTLETATPVDAAVQAIQATVDQANGALADLDKVRQAATDVLGGTALGPLATQVIEAARGKF